MGYPQQGPRYPEAGSYMDQALGGIAANRYGAATSDPGATMIGDAAAGFGQGIGAAVGGLGQQFGNNARAGNQMQAMQFGNKGRGYNQSGLPGGIPVGGATRASEDQWAPVTYTDAASGNTRTFIPGERQFEQKQQLIQMLMGLFGGGGGMNLAGGPGLMGFTSNTGQSAFLPGAIPAANLQPYNFSV